MSVSGSWSAVTDSPVGKQTMILQLTEVDGTVTGTAATDDETVEVTDGSVDGEKLTFKVPVTKPMKMGLVFDVVLAGDAFEGKVKAGFFPPMKVAATRT